MGIRETLHLGHRVAKRPDDADHPHEFKRLSDSWVGHGVPPFGGGRGDASAPTVVAAYQFTGQQCAVCRRTPEDPIHFPVQDQV